jgi:hypothetical protein
MNDGKMEFWRNLVIGKKTLRFEHNVSKFKHSIVFDQCKCSYSYFDLMVATNQKQTTEIENNILEK